MDNSKIEKDETGKALKSEVKKMPLNDFRKILEEGGIIYVPFAKNPPFKKASEPEPSKKIDSLESPNNSQSPRTFHLVWGFIVLFVSIFIVNYFNNFFAAIVGMLIFWFSFTNIITGFAPSRYLFLLRMPKENWSEADKVYIDRVASRITTIKYWIFGVVIILVLLINILLK